MDQRTTLAAAALLGLLAAGCAPSPEATGGRPDSDSRPARESGPWTRRFPEIAPLVPHFEQRMASQSASARLNVLTELTYFHYRDTRLFTPFLKTLVRDPTPKIRWEALWRLHQHGILLPAEEVPDELEVPLVGRLKPRDRASLEAFRKVVADAEEGDPRAGWALEALTYVRDREAPALARKRLTSSNVFVRFSATTTLLEVGAEADRDAAMAELEKLTAAPDDGSGFYRMRSAEILIRLGQVRHLETLIGAYEARSGGGYADSGADVLSDLTGVYFVTLAEWRAWYDKNKGQIKIVKP